MKIKDKTSRKLDEKKRELTGVREETERVMARW